MLCLLPMAAWAQERLTGSLEGRVFNPASGEYTERARVTIEGTALEAFTDVDGRYRLNRVPVGNVRVDAFYTGAVFETKSAVVSADATTQLDFDWMASSAQNGVVTLEKLTISASRDMSSSAIAINTQRFAPNTMTVVAADEYGPVASHNIGHVLNNVPGITVELGGLGNPNTISMNGAPSANVPLMVNGMQLSHAVDGIGTRSVSTNNLSLNNMSRIEVIFTPTPETPGSALAGSINLVPRSSFDRVKPTYSYTASMVMRDRERTLSRTPGMGGRGSSHKITPEFSASAVVPINDKLGFTLSASSSVTRNTRTQMRHFWRGLSTDTNGTTYPDTTPDKPYLWSIGVFDGYDELERNTIAGSLDFKIGPRDRFSFAVQYGQFNIAGDQEVLTYEISRVLSGNFSPTFTQGDAGQGLMRINRNYTNREDQTWLNTLNYWHDGPVWRLEAGAGYSSSYSDQTRQKGLDFGDTIANRTGLTIRFDDAAAFLPGVTLTDSATGQPVNPNLLANYRVISANAPDGVNQGSNRRLFASAQRHFDWQVPFAAKVGFSMDQILRDHVNNAINWAFVGADGVANNADNTAAPFVNEALSRRERPYGYAPIQWIDAGMITDLFRSNPAYFTKNDLTVYNNTVNNSKAAEELVTAAYLRGDLSLFTGRLKLVGGLRAEQTNVEGQGNLQDAALNFQRNASGQVILGGNGQPLLINPAGSLAATQLTNVERGFKAEKEYLRWFPSLNFTYNVRDNLLLRGGYFHSVGRPSFLQYAGTLILPDTNTLPSASNRISVNNVGIKAWDGRSFKLALEYYFKNVGLVSVGGYLRDIENFFGTTVFRASPEFLSLYSLDPDVYGDYDVSTQYNIPGKVRMRGLDFNYKQSLTFLPDWARGVSVFANFSVQRASGANDANFAGMIPRSGNWGATFSRAKFTLRARWNYESRSRMNLVSSGRSVGPDVYQWRGERTTFTLSGDYRVWKKHSLFFNIANLTDEPIIFEYAGPSTPVWAQRSTNSQNTPLVTIGLQGSF